MDFQVKMFTLMSMIGFCIFQVCNNFNKINGEHKLFTILRFVMPQKGKRDFFFWMEGSNYTFTVKVLPVVTVMQPSRMY